MPNPAPKMNTDRTDQDKGTDGFTEVQVEMPEELYHKAIAAAQAEGVTLDELVAEMIKKEVGRRAVEGGKEGGK